METKESAFTIHRSPVILIFEIIFLAIFFDGIFFVITIFGWRKLATFFTDINHLGIFGIVVGIQVLLTLLLIIKWYRETYSLDEHFIYHRWGIILIKEEHFRLSSIDEINYRETLTGKIFRYATIHIRYANDETSHLSAVPYPTFFINMINEKVYDTKK